MTNISFQGKSNLFISGDIYNQFLQKSESTRRVITKTRSENVLSVHKPFLTMPTPDDLVVIIRNERNGFMKKFPVLSKIEQIADDICRKIEDLQKDTTEKLTAWIIGGNNYKQDNGNTIKAVNELGEVLCDRPDIDTSILAGPKYKTADGVGIQANIGETNIILTKGKNTSVTSPEDLEDFFDIVELNNVDTKID